MKNAIVLIATLIVSSKITRAHNDIKCYSCSTKDNADCLHPEENGMALKTCKLDSMKEMHEMVKKVEPDMEHLFEVDVPPNFHFNCMKQVVKVVEDEYVIRGCHPANPDEKLDICKLLWTKKFAKTNVTYCSLCNRDACNSGRNFHHLNVYNLVMFAIFLFKFNL